MLKKIDKSQNIFKIVLSIIAIVVFSIGFIDAFEKYKIFVIEQKLSKVRVSIYNDKNSICKDVAKPIQLKIYNGANENIIKSIVELGVEGENSNHNIANQILNKTVLNKIIKANEEYTFCTHSPINHYAIEVTKYNIGNLSHLDGIKIGDLVFRVDYKVYIDKKSFVFE